MSTLTHKLGDAWGRWRGNAPAEGPDALPVRVHGTEFTRTRAAPVRVKGFDQPLIWVAVTLLRWGSVMVYSASIAMPDNPRFGNYAQNHFLLRHTAAIGVALVAAALAYQVPMDTWDKWAPWLFIASLVLLIVVLIPGIGKEVNGARRWIAMGFINFQPSELAKLGVLLYAANYMVRKMEVKEKFFSAVAPMGVAVAVVGSLLLAEPDMGAFMVIAMIAMGILFLGGVNARMFFLIALVLIIAFVLMIALSEWRRDRIFAYLNPWDPKYALGKGYQLSHSLIAIGRGEIFGVGLGGSVEKLHWLPEASAHRLFARRDRRRVWFCRRGDHDRFVPVVDPAHHAHWPPSHCHGPRVLWAGGPGCGGLGGFSGLHQHGCELGRLAHQGLDLALDELRRFGHLAQFGGPGHCVAGGP